MDLALAKFVEGKLPGAGRLDAVQYGLLTQACRQAKEALLGPNPPASQPVTVVGRGRAVIGGTLSTQLTTGDVQRVIFDGFFPDVPVDAEPQRGARMGLHEMGLPYVTDPAITRHLASFLKQQASVATGGSPVAPDNEPPSLSRKSSGAPPVATGAPAAVLFNGGVFQPASLRQRLLEVMHHWYDRPDRPWQPLVLTTPSLDLAVAWGAAYFAYLRHTGGKRIGGGIARSYYIAISTSEPPDLSRRTGLQTRPDGSGDPSYGDKPGGSLTVVCVVPQHLEEGQELVLDKPELELALGQPVRFPLYTSTVRADDKAGDVLQFQPEQLLQLSPLQTVLRGGKRSGTKNVPVTLAARSTAIGTLELYCVSRDGQNRWRLEFNIRDLIQPAPARAEVDGEAAPGIIDVWPEHQVQEAARLIRQVFVDPDVVATAARGVWGDGTPPQAPPRRLS